MEQIARKVVVNGVEIVNLERTTASITDVSDGELFYDKNGILVEGNGTAPGALTINGIIREYVVNSGVSIEAGDFVEFIANYGKGVFGESTIAYINALQLDDSNILLVYKNTGSSRAVGTVLQITNGLLALGEETVLLETAAEELSACAMSSKKALVAVKTLEQIQMVLVEVSDFSIQVRGKTTISANGSAIKLAALSSEKALMAYKINTSIYCGAIFVGEDSFSISSFIGQTPGPKEIAQINLIKLTNNKGLLVYDVYGPSTDEPLIAQTVLISGTQVSVGARKVLHTAWRMHTHTVVALTETSAIVIASGSLTSSTNKGTKVYSLYIAGDAVSLEKQQSFSQTDTLSNFQLQFLTQNELVFSYSTSSKSFVELIKILPTANSHYISHSISSFSFNKLVGLSQISILSEESFVVFYIEDYCGKYTSFIVTDNQISENDYDVGVRVQPVTQSKHEVGIAKSSGTAGQTIRVYCIPNN